MELHLAAQRTKFPYHPWSTNPKHPNDHPAAVVAPSSDAILLQIALS
jgi:hypothetical protein